MPFKLLCAAMISYGQVTGAAHASDDGLIDDALKNQLSEFKAGEQRICCPASVIMMGI